MSKPTIIPNWKYQKPTKGGYKGLKKLLKYVSHRESPDHRPLEAEVRWTDCGMGSSWKEVYQKAGALAGPYVLAHHMVISPAPGPDADGPRGYPPGSRARSHGTHD